MVYYLSWDADALPALSADWQQYLPAHRIEKVLAYKSEKDRVTSVLAFLLLRYALHKEYAITAIPQIETDENGKPFDINKKHHFNLSHCDTAVACALDRTPVGGDVQDFRPVRENVVKKVCSEEEQRRLQENGYDEKLFAAFWASKEAYGKYSGHGIGYDLKKHSLCPEMHFPQSVQFGKLWVQTALYDDFALSVCAVEPQQIISVTYAELSEFLSLLSEI